MLAPPCTACHDNGLRTLRQGRKRRTEVCACVARRAFRAVVGRYRQECSGSWPRLATEITPLGILRGYKEAEFRADVELNARRVLDPWRHWLFRLYLADALPAAGGENFLDALYGLEAELGRQFVEAGLYPTRRYFAARIWERWPLRTIHSSGWSALSTEVAM